MSKKETKMARQAALRAKRERDRRVRIALIAGPILLVVAGLGGLYAVRGQSSKAAANIGGTAKPNGPITATEISVANEGQTHIPTGQGAQYNHYPPSSGPHWGSPAGPVPWGFSSAPIPPEAWVHNLEHGGIVVLYNCPDNCPDTVTALKKLADEVPPSKYGSHKIVVTSDAKITSKIIALAWGRELDLSDFDRTRLLEFYKRFVDHGPEDVP